MKKRLLKVFSMIISVVMGVSVLLGVAACGNNEKKPDDEPQPAAKSTLVVAYSNFSNKFSPFFATSSYDVDVYSMTQVGLLAGDRGGNIVEKGIEGETIPYNGHDYTYYGLSNLTITQNEDGSVYYDIQMRTGDKTVYFSDGKPVTVKDAIFSMYVLSDNDYDGSTTFYSLPIKGMTEWRTNLSSDVLEKYNAIADAIMDTYDEDEGGYVYDETSTKYTKEQFDGLMAKIYAEENWVALANDIIEFVAGNYGSYTTYGNPLSSTSGVDLTVPGQKVAFGMSMWGFGGFDGDKFVDSIGNEYDLVETFPTVDVYVDNLKYAYDGDITAAINTETAGGVAIENYVDIWKAEAGHEEMNGKDVESISGITFDEAKGTIRIETTEFSATTIYQLAVSVAPLHYYGSESLWDPANGSYGFTRNDLNSVREKTTTPMGAGPYKFVSYQNGIVTFEANEKYWEGAPKIKNIMFKEYSKDEDKLPALLNGEVDVAEPSISEAVCDQIKSANKETTLSMNSPNVATDLVDFNGYGYIGINSDNVKVGADKGSEESKNLRKAFATVFAAYREYTVNSYYEDRASVIQYPISNCSWAAPQPADDGYAIAFSKDVDGNPIYTADMNDEARYAAALEAAKGFLKEAGYTYDEAAGKFTAAPEGAKLEYEAIIGGGGTGDHPTMALLNKAADDFAKIGITLTVTDITNSSDLFGKMEAGTAEIFVAAWGGASDPDMYQVYHSSNTTNSNHYHIADEELDNLIIEARTSANKKFRKDTYKACLDIILDWAVEIPVYQRKNCTVFSAERINISTVTPDTTPFWSYLAEIYKLEVK